MNLPPIKIGLVGQPSSGKDVAALYLENHYHFIHPSTGDFIRKYVDENNLGEKTRPLLQQTGNFLREKYGSDYLVKLALAQKGDQLVISGIRNVGEVQALKKAGGKLVAIEAPIEKRYEWAVKRNRPGDQLTMEEFRKQQEFEENNADPNVQNILAVIEMADYVLPNSGTLEELYQKIDNLLTRIST